MWFLLLLACSTDDDMLYRPDSAGSCNDELQALAVDELTPGGWSLQTVLDTSGGWSTPSTTWADGSSGTLERSISLTGPATINYGDCATNTVTVPATWTLSSAALSAAWPVDLVIWPEGESWVATVAVQAARSDFTGSYQVPADTSSWEVRLIQATESFRPTGLTGQLWLDVEVEDATSAWEGMEEVVAWSAP